MLQNYVADTRVSSSGRKGKTRLRSLSKLDGRSGAAKKARRLIELWREALGSVTPLQEMLLAHAATCVVIAEDAQARMLSDDPSISVGELTKLNNIASRAMRQIGLPVAGREAERNTGLGLRPLR